VKLIDTLNDLIARLPEHGSRTFLFKMEKKDARQYAYTALYSQSRRLAPV
jgi:hypothetical protein